MRDVLRSLLNGAGYTVLPAASGREALSLAANLDALLAIVDLDMPDGNGLQTCAALRQMPNWLDVPILVLTHHNTDKALNAARSAGASGFVGKPFVPAELLQHIARVTGVHTVANPEPPAKRGLIPQPMIESTNRPKEQRPLAGFRETSRATQGASLDQQHAVLRVYRKLNLGVSSQDQQAVIPEGLPRLLLGEQDPATLAAVRDALEAEGWVVDVANDGRKTLATFIMNEYDLLLVNDRLPALSGIEIAHAVRSLEGPKGRVPIVALLENDSRLLQRDLTEASINGHLAKPVATNALLDCVRHHLPKKASMQLDAQPHGTGRAPDIETLCNVAKMFAPGAMVQFLSSMVTAVEEMLPMLHGGWVVATPDDIVRRAHSLAGTAGTLGCVALSTAARALEADHAESIETQQRFIATAHATLRVVRAYMAQ